MSGASSDEELPDTTANAAVDDHPVVHIRRAAHQEPGRRTYTRAEVAARWDKTAASLAPGENLARQISKNVAVPRFNAAAVIPRFDRAVLANTATASIAQDFIKNTGATSALSRITASLDKVTKGVDMKAVTGIDWARVAPRLPSTLGTDLIKNSGIFGAQGIGPRWGSILEDIESMVPEIPTSGILPVTESEFPAPEYSFPDLPPNPAHETNRQLRELLDVARDERDQMLRDREAEQQRERGRELQRQQEKQHDRRVAVFGIVIGAVGTVAGVVGAVAAILALT